MMNAAIIQNKLVLPSIQQAMVINTPEFSEFVDSKKDAKGVLDSNATTKEYIETLKKKYDLTETDREKYEAQIQEKVKDPADKRLLLSFAASDFGAVDRVTITRYVETTANVEKQFSEVAKTGKIATPTGEVEVSDSVLQKLKDRGTKGLAKDFMEAPVGTTVNLAKDIISGSGSSAPIVFVGMLYLAFKLLTGEIKGFSGWQLLLGGLFLHGVTKSLGGVEKATELLDGLG